MWLRYDASPFVLDRARKYEQPKLGAHRKPNGFWFTDQTEHCWKWWCEAESFMTNCLTHKHEVRLDENNLLFLRGPHSLDGFTRQYAVEDSWEWQGNLYVEKCIDWARVASEYAGIVITPYVWERRLYDHYSWYYCWDCASGCVWDLSAVQDVVLLEICEPVLGKTP